MQSRIPHKYDQRVFEEKMQARQRQAFYPELLDAALHERNSAVYAKQRPGSGLLVVALRHDRLTLRQRRQLAEFRLHQYALCGWYDIPTLASHHIETDPAFDSLPPGTVHVLVGGPDARLLAYFCMQPAAHAVAPTQLPDEDSPPAIATFEESATFRDPQRPLFCMEVESFGPDVFPSLPAMLDTPLSAARELSCLIRNQAISSPLSVLATLEAVYTMVHVVLNSDTAIEVTLGCIDIEARSVTSVLGIPFLYAPLAPVVLDSFDYYWAHSVNEPGRFWPFVISTTDLRAHAEHFHFLDTTLDGSKRDIMRAIINLRRQPVLVEPEALMPPPGESRYIWTADPMYPVAETATSAVSAPVGADANRPDAI